MTDIKKVDYNLVVSMDYTLSIDGKIIDSSEGNGPLDYLHGHNNIIPGLERELLGMTIGEGKNVVVAPEDGYGEFDEEAFAEVPVSAFPEAEDLTVGSNVEMEDEDGVVMDATVTAIEDDLAYLDFNHPLADKELHFDVKIVALRAATDEELEHGHVHYEHEQD